MNKRRVIEAPGITVTGPYAPAIESEDLVFFFRPDGTGAPYGQTDAVVALPLGHALK